MKFIRKAAAIALVGAMIVTTVQTAAPDVVKAQVLYETKIYRLQKKGIHLLSVH